MARSHPLDSASTRPYKGAAQQHETTNGAPSTGSQHLQPIDPSTGEPLPQRAQPGYYPGFATLSQQKFWDEATRTVVLKRVNQPPPLRFFTPAEARQMQAVIDRVLPQDDRDEAHRIPILNAIDERLFSGRIDGYRFDDMPPDPEAHRLGLQAIDQIAQDVYGHLFIDLAPEQQEAILKSIHDIQPASAHAIWQRMNCKRYWMLLMQDCIEAYYAHPWAWDEIGFGGPAYPRGYMRLEHGLPEPWEVNEQRYEWSGPGWSVSNEFTPIGGDSESSPSGQEGTH